MSGRSIELNISEVSNNLKKLDEVAKAQLTVVAESVSKNMETYAKANHPWINRTSSAQDQLHGGYTWNNHALDITISHGVDYGYYLEKSSRFDGKYQILEKARDSEINNFKNMVKALNLGGK